MTFVRTLAVLSLAVAVASRGGDEAHRGAKEMFFDPQEASISMSPSAAPAPKPEVDENERRVVHVRPDRPPQRSLGLSYWIELMGSTSDRGTQVTDDRTFRSGERIQLHFRGNAAGRILIVQLGSSGTSSVLFPDATKGVADNSIRANRDQILPAATHWFRFDDNAGTEKLLVLFARTQAELDRTFPTRRVMDAETTAALLAAAERVTGSKDLVIETETEQPTEIGTYAVNVAGKPIVMQIQLKHQ